MDYQMLVKNLFNDMFVFLNGKEPLGIEPLQDAYQEEPLFLALIGGLDEAVRVSYNDAMKECYAFYKRYCGRALSEADWDQVVDEIKKFNEKWKNAWCSRVILALLDLLEKENRERKKEQQENAENTAGEETENPDEMESAA